MENRNLTLFDVRLGHLNERGTKEKPLAFPYRGKYVTYKDIENMYGIPKKIIYNRIFGLKWRLHDAIESPIQTNKSNTTERIRRTYEYNGEILTSGDIERKYGIKADTLREKVKKGYRVEEIIEAPINYGRGHRQHAKIG